MVFGEVLEHVLRDGWDGTAIDRRISHFVAGHRFGWLTGIMRGVTDLGASEVLGAIALVTTAGLLSLR